MQQPIDQQQQQQQDIAQKGNVTFQMRPESAIKMATAVRGSTNVDIEIYNGCKHFVAYQLRSNCPRLFTMKPCSKSLLAPKETQPMQLTLLPGHSYSATYQLLLEATLLPQVKDRKEFTAAAQLQLAQKENITRMLIPLHIIDPTRSLPEVFKIRVTENVEGTNFESTILDRATKVVERIRREDLMGASIVFLCTYMIIAFVFGYSVRSFECAPCKK